jgi:hypothetical protein
MSRIFSKQRKLSVSVAVGSIVAILRRFLSIASLTINKKQRIPLCLRFLLIA